MDKYLDFTVLGIYLIGAVLIPFFLKKKKRQQWLLWELGWAVLLFFSYVLLLESRNHTFYFVIPLGFFALFAFFYFKEKRRLINGFLFNLFLVSLAAYLTVLLFQTENLFLMILAFLVVVDLVLILLFGLYALIIFLYWNGFVVLKKEGPSLANLLTLLLAISLTVYLFYATVASNLLPEWTAPLLSIVPFLLFYFFFVFYNFLTISILYQFNRPRYSQDYIVVLGAGLLNGETVTPLLKARIDKAIHFYHAQTYATLHSPTLVMSGGQGPDEKIPESIAMKQYALAQGIPETDILVETRSRNTLENMRFSKELMLDHYGSEDFQAIFTTNNYHLFRAGLFARQTHLAADGIGAKTAFYFLPNAFLREYLAVLVMYKRQHLIVSSLVIVLLVIAAAINLFIVH